MNSNLQIISGKYRGRKLALPNGARPTQNRARIALFNMLGELHIGVTNVWDAFAGSGAFGLEFLSRGWATNAIFSDTAPESIRTIKKNSESFSENFEIFQRDAILLIPTIAPKTDIVFVDPPYTDFDSATRFISDFLNHCRSGTIIIWEIDTITQINSDMFLNHISDRIEILKDKKYGRARMVVIRAKSR